MHVSCTVIVSAPPRRVFELLSDYEQARPTLLPAQYYTDYRLVQGGHGRGTVARWVLHFTKTRFREIEVVVDTPQLSVVETDNNSTLLTRYTVEQTEGQEPAQSRITAQTSWRGAENFMRYLERLLAPSMMRKIHAAFLANVKKRCETGNFGNGRKTENPE